MRHSRHRADSNHWEILAALKKVTAVRDIHHCSGGLGDILAAHAMTGIGIFLEVKSGPKDKLTDAEAAFGLQFRNWQLVYTVEDALRAIGL